MKRGLSFLLVLALCLSLCPVSGFALDLGGAAAVGSEAVAETPVIVEPAVEAPVAEETAEEPPEEAEEELAEDAAADMGEVTASGSCGENVTWSLADGVLTISGTGAMRDYNELFRPYTSSDLYDVPWNFWADDDTYQYITSIVVEEGVTYIGDHAFYNLCNATELVLPASVTSAGVQAFGHYSSLYITDLATWVSTASLPSADNVYLNGSLLKEIEEVVLPDSVTSIRASAFRDCTNLTSVTLPSNLESIGASAFRGCTNLTSISLPASLLSIGSDAFLDSGLESPPNYFSASWTSDADGNPQLSWNAADGVVKYEIFRDGVKIAETEELNYTDSEAVCGKIYSYAVRGLDAGSAPAAYSGLCSVTCTLEAPVVSISGRDADGNVILTWSAVEGAVEYKVYHTYYDFDESEWATYINVEQRHSTTSDTSFACTESYSYEPGEIASTTIRSGSPFYVIAVSESGMESRISNRLGSCGSDAFYSLSGGQLTIFGTGTAAGLGSDFGDNSRRHTLEKSTVTSVVIRDGITGIEDFTFKLFSKLTSVTLPDTVTSIGEYAFTDCSSLTEISLSDSLTSIGKYAFDGCSGLTSITLPDSLTSIGEYAFSGCSGLTEITIPGAVKSVGNSFGSCSGLESIVLEEGVISLGANAFQNRSALKEIHIPATVKNIGAGAFNGCSALTDIYYDGTSEEWDDIVIESDNVPLYTAELHCSGPLPATAAPVISVANVASSGKPRLSWNAVDGAVKYEVWRAYSKSGTYYKMGTTSGTTYTNSGAEAGKNYYYKVRTLNADGIASDYSNIVSITCDCAQPSFSISCVASSGKPRLSWTAVSGAVQYEVWRATSKTGTYYKQGSTTGTAYTNTGATAGKTYYYKIYAVGSSSYSKSVASSVKNITCDYAQPVVSISTNASTGKPKLSWNAVSGATKYEIWRATSRTGTFTKVYTTANTYFNNTTAEANKSYYYKVRAIGSSSYATSAYSSMVSITCDCAKPVVSISCNASTGKPKLSWSAVSGAVKYEIWRATSRNGTYTKIYTTTNTYFNNTTAVASKSYYYKVRAIGTSSYATSAYSTIVSITCDCARPVVTATTNSSGKPRLSWGAVEGAVKYEIWRSGYRNGTYTKIFTTSNTYFNNTTASSGYTYYYKVRAIGSSSYATSAYSSIVSAKCK